MGRSVISTSAYCLRTVLATRGKFVSCKTVVTRLSVVKRALGCAETPYAWKQVREYCREAGHQARKHGLGDDYIAEP